MSIPLQKNLDFSYRRIRKNDLPYGRSFSVITRLLNVLRVLELLDGLVHLALRDSFKRSPRRSKVRASG